jgi:hypothetical protein
VEGDIGEYEENEKLRSFTKFLLEEAKVKSHLGDSCVNGSTIQ